MADKVTVTVVEYGKQPKHVLYDRIPNTGDYLHLPANDGTAYFDMVQVVAVVLSHLMRPPLVIVRQLDADDEMRKL